SPVPTERAAHLLVNADGSFLAAYHLREHPAARDRVCAGNTRIESAWIAVGSSARESTFTAGCHPMMPRATPGLRFRTASLAMTPATSQGGRAPNLHSKWVQK